MTVLAIYLAVIAALAGWWLSHQQLTAKPWLEQGTVGAPPETADWRPPTMRTGLGIFFAVAGSLFALSITAYFMRMNGADWTPLPKPSLLWLNTDILFASSVALYWAQRGVRRGDLYQVRLGLLAGGLTALIFVAGQALAWRQLNAAGYGLASNPANTFFYLLTGMHGLHLLGGLVALARTGAAAWRPTTTQDLRLNVDLCAMYWHFLLLVWLLLFGVLMLT
jgi:cytochrome c oxidase subunit 3